MKQADMINQGTSRSQPCPVIIVGGGIVGGLTALLLAQGGVQVTLIDAAAMPDLHDFIQRNDARVLAINPASIQLLQHVGAWQKLIRHQPYSGMHVTNQNNSGELMFGRASDQPIMQRDWLGSMVEPQLLHVAIALCLAEHPLVETRYKAKITHLDGLTKGWRVRLSTGESWSTNLLIGADGANSMVRSSAQIEVDELDYHQSAITAALHTEQPHRHVARQIFLTTGPLALLPMASLTQDQAQNWQSLVWTLPTEQAIQYQRLDDQQLADKITQASYHALGHVLELKSRAQFPLKARHARRYIGQHVALVGDAAHVIHPLAGQGVNLGCLDAAILADNLLTDLQRGVWAHQQTLLRYEMQRRPHNRLMMHSMSALGWINQQQFAPLVQVRGSTLGWVADQTRVLDFFQRQASGLSHLAKTRYRMP